MSIRFYNNILRIMLVVIVLCLLGTTVNFVKYYVSHRGCLSCGYNCFYNGADGHLIKLINNKSATDPSFEYLESFLINDQTNKIVYDTDKFVCADYAEVLHNDAEKNGIKAGYVNLDFNGYDVLHACNVFNTTNAGLIFVDDTGSVDGIADDGKVDIMINESYCVYSFDGSFKLWCVENESTEYLYTVKEYNIDW